MQSSEQLAKHKVTMVNRLLAAICAVTTSTSCFANEPVKVDPLDSKDFARVIEQALKQKGAEIVPDGGEAAVRIFVVGGYSINQPGHASINGKIGELFAPGRVLEGDKTLRYQTINERQIVMGTVTNTLSIAEVVSYLSQISGVSGWVNSKLTGDPRGVCAGERCDQVKTEVMLILTMESSAGHAHWTVKATSYDKTQVIDHVLGAAVEELMKPLQLQPPPAGRSVDG